MSKTLHVPKRELCLSVSLLQNSEMLENRFSAQSVYLLQNSDMLENEIKNR